jgi:predicted AlkP superfamily phosphohydrolase/phosphomutase
MKTLIIGLDAATWRLMTPLVQQGKLSTIKKLIDEGVSGMIHSTMPPMTPPTWASIVTGVNPGKHGIYDFVKQDRRTYRISPINYLFRNRPAIWDIFNAYKKKVCVVNFPLVFPPPKVDAFFISGLASPERKFYSHPPKLNKYLKSRGYRIHPRFGPEKGAKQYFDEVKNLTEIQCEVSIELMKQWDWELFWVVFQGLDWIQHYLWNAIIEGENAVVAFYYYMDHVIKRFLQEAQDNWNIVILSDHGFRKIRAEIHLNNILEKWGYLKRIEISQGLAEKIRNFTLRVGWKLGRNLSFAVKQWIKRHIPEKIYSDLRELLNEQLRLHEMIDWSRTRAFSFGYMGRIYIHKKGKYPQGTVTAKEYEVLREEIIAQLKSLKDPKTEKPIIGEIFRKEEIYTGNQLQGAPDIIFNPSDFAYMIYGDFSSSWYKLPEGRIADHDMEGILIMKGKNIRKGIKISAKAIDIAPTLLYLHNLPLLDDMDGRVLKKAFTEELKSIRKIQTVKTTIFTGKKEKHKYSKAELQEIEKRLHELGYL